MEILRDPDAELVATCRVPGGEAFERAFEDLFHRYRDRAYAISYRILGNSIDALDVVQESFALVFRKLDSFRGGSLFSTWLFRIVVNCSIDLRRRARPHRPLSFGSPQGQSTQDPSARGQSTHGQAAQGWGGQFSDSGRLVGGENLADQLVDQAPDPRDRAAASELGDQVQEALAMLSPKLRVILALRYLEAMSYEELAATLGLSLGTVKSRLARAHLALESVVRTRFPHLDLSGAAPDSVGGVG